MKTAYLLAAARTPFGKLGGAWAGVRPDNLAANALTGLLAKAPRPGLDCRVLVPAAIEGVLHGENARVVRARIVVEGANEPTTAVADSILEANGVVVPDILPTLATSPSRTSSGSKPNQARW